MYDKQLPTRPNLAQYKKQAKELAHNCALSDADALTRVRKHHPRIHAHPETAPQASLTDAQLVLAREHGFESWPRFASHIETLRIIRSVEAITDPIAAFIEAACAPRHSGHGSGTLEHAELYLSLATRKSPPPNTSNTGGHPRAISNPPSAASSPATQALATSKGGYLRNGTPSPTSASLASSSTTPPGPTPSSTPPKLCSTQVPAPPPASTR